MLLSSFNPSLGFVEWIVIPFLRLTSSFLILPKSYHNQSSFVDKRRRSIHQERVYDYMHSSFFELSYHYFPSFKYHILLILRDDYPKKDPLVANLGTKGGLLLGYGNSKPCFKRTNSYGLWPIFLGILTLKRFKSLIKGFP